MIPKIIHHIWPGNDPFKQKYHAWRASWMKYNPDYTMMFWNLSNLPYNLFTHAGAELAKSNLCYVSKSDLCRYEILYLFGGIYVDCDMECRKNFDSLLKTSSFAGQGYSHDGIPNAIIGTKPKSDIFASIREVVSKSFVEEWEAANDPKRLFDVPEGGMHKISKKFLTQFETIHPVHVFYPFDCLDHGEKRKKDFSHSYTIHHWSGMEKDGWAHADYSKNRTPSLA